MKEKSSKDRSFKLNTKNDTPYHTAVSNGDTMSCADVQGLIFDYLDGELDRSTAGRMSAHFEVCDECRAELDECRRMLEAIGRLERPVPFELHSRVMAEVAKTPQDTSRLGRFFAEHRTAFKRIGASIAPVAACVALIVGVGLMNDREAQTADLTAADSQNEAVYGSRSSDTGAASDSETVDAMKFSSPSAGAISDYGALYDNAYNDDGETRTIDRDIADESGAYMVEAAAESGSLTRLLSELVDHSTAVLMLESTSSVGRELGDEIKLAGHEDIVCRELFELEENSTEGLMTRAAEALEDYELLLPNGDYDSLIICYGLETIGVERLGE